MPGFPVAASPVDVLAPGTDVEGAVWPSLALAMLWLLLSAVQRLQILKVSGRQCLETTLHFGACMFCCCKCGEILWREVVKTPLQV